jgi:hypothetical protein
MELMLFFNSACQSILVQSIFFNSSNLLKVIHPYDLKKQFIAH